MSKANNILLIGFMGCGKSTIGRLLSQKLDFSFTDTDSSIERISGKTIPELFKISEPYFRTWELTVCKGLSRLSSHVIATGGGIVTQEKCRKHLKNSGTVIYLKTTATTILERLKHDTKRPLLQHPNKLEVIQNLLQDREALYNDTCHYNIDVDSLSIDEVITQIMLKLEC